MDLKHWVKQCIPPIFLDCYRAYRGGENLGYTWKGIYRHYQDVPVSGAGYNSEQLGKKTLAYTRNHLAVSAQYLTIPTEVVGEHSFLPFLASLICKNRGSVRVLDFGGGMGVAYIHLKNGTVACSAIDYHIIENDVMCGMGSKLFENDPQVHFHNKLPSELSGVDVVYMCSALQYIEDYSELLKTLCDYRPRYFLFVKLSSGDIPTYASAQKNISGITFPYWFLNIDEIIRIMADNNYSLIFKGVLEHEYDQSNFPSEYRLRRACNLLFRRSGNE
jgi:putative methyltransferase (TIGR04325 family)